MYILQGSVILFLFGIFRGTYETQTCSKDHNWEVAEFCQTTQSTGNTVILDGYGVYKNGSPGQKCKCTAIVSIPSNGSSTIIFNKLSSLQPNYKGCGSHISIQGSGQSLIQRCYIAGTMQVKNQEHVEIELVKDYSPVDTQYCMKIHIEDLSASLKVNCYSQTATTPSQSTVTLPAMTSTSSENVTTNTVPSDIPETTTSKFTNTTLTHISTSKQSQATSNVTLDDIPIESTDKTIPYTHATSPVAVTKSLVTQTISPVAQSESTVTQMSSHVRQTTSNGTQGESVTTSSETKPTSSVTHTTSPDKHTTHTVSLETTPSSTQSDGITTSNSTVGDSTTTRDAPTTKLDTPITQQTSITESSSQSITMTSIQNSTTTLTTKDPSAGGTSSDKDLPIEVVIPIACVGGLLLIFMIICIFVGLRRRNVCGCDDELVPKNNNLVDKVSVDIKNREKDTYVNPLYDDISLTGKSDRSDKDSMMQEIQSDDEDYTVDSYHIPVSTEIDGELWTHL